MQNGIIPSEKNQILVLDRLSELYFSGIDGFVEIVSEMTGEISFRELRATIVYLVEFGYIQRSYIGKGNEFFVKVTKKGIKYYEKIFKSEGKLFIKESFLEKIKNFSKGIDAIKGIATGSVAILTIFGVTFHGEIQDKFSAKILGNNISEIQFTEKEALSFLNKNFSKDFKFSCKVKKINQIICRIVKNTNELINYNVDMKKTLFNDKIVLIKDINGKIILSK